MQILETRSEVKIKDTVTQGWYVTLCHPKMHRSTHQIYAPDTIILKTSYVSLPHLKIHQHTKFGVPTLKNIGDMQQTQSRMDRQKDGLTVQLLYASQSSKPPKVPLGA